MNLPGLSCKIRFANHYAMQSTPVPLICFQKPDDNIVTEVYVVSYMAQNQKRDARTNAFLTLVQKGVEEGYSG